MPAPTSQNDDSMETRNLPPVDNSTGSEGESNFEASDINEELEDIFGILSGEEEQEKELKDESTSFLAQLNTELVREREREYRDESKHWVRLNIWLDTAKRILREKQAAFADVNQKLRYLTLPAYYRFDVSLFMINNLIEITDEDIFGGPREIYVAAFETDPTKYGRMVGQEPRFKLFGSSSLEDALVVPTNPYYLQLSGLFPFDIVNLDLTTSLTPKHEGPYSRTMQAIETVFERQVSCSWPWALFLTFRNLPDDWEGSALDQLFNNLQSNIDQHPKVREAFISKHKEINVASLCKQDIKSCISQSVTKWIVDRAHSHRFELQTMKCCYYTRYNPGIAPYDIFKHVYIFRRGDLLPAIIPTKGVPTQAWMIDNLVSCIESHSCLDVERKILNLVDRGQPNLFADLQYDIERLIKLIS